MNGGPSLQPSCLPQRPRRSNAERGLRLLRITGFNLAPLLGVDNFATHFRGNIQCRRGGRRGKQSCKLQSFATVQNDTRNKTNTFNRMWEFHKACSEIIDLTRRFSREQHRSLAIHNAKSTGLVMAYKRLEQNVFKWPAIKDSVLRFDPAQFEALFAGLDWRRVTALETLPPAAAE